MRQPLPLRFRLAHAHALGGGGRATTLSLCLGEWVHFAVAHVDSPQTLATRKRLISDMSSYLEVQPVVVFVMGDWNFVHPDETRMTSTGDELRPTVNLAQLF